MCDVACKTTPTAARTRITSIRQHPCYTSSIHLRCTSSIISVCKAHTGRTKGTLSMCVTRAREGRLWLWKSFTRNTHSYTLPPQPKCPLPHVSVGQDKPESAPEYTLTHRKHLSLLSATPTTSAGGSQESKSLLLHDAAETSVEQPHVNNNTSSFVAVAPLQQPWRITLPVNTLRPQSLTQSLAHAGNPCPRSQQWSPVSHMR